MDYLFALAFFLQVCPVPRPEGWPEVEVMQSPPWKGETAEALLLSFFAVLNESQGVTLAADLSWLMQGETHKLSQSEGRDLVFSKPPLAAQRAVTNVLLKLAASSPWCLHRHAYSAFQTVFASTWAYLLEVIAQGGDGKSQKVVEILRELNRLICLRRGNARELHDEVRRMIYRHVQALVLEGELGLAEEMVRVLAWTGAFGYKLARPEITVNRATGPDSLIYAAMRELVEMVVRIEGCRMKPGVHAGLVSFLWLETSVRYDLARAGQAREPVATNSYHPLGVMDQVCDDRGRALYPDGRDFDPSVEPLAEPRVVSRVGGSPRFALAYAAWSGTLGIPGDFDELKDPILEFSEVTDDKRPEQLVVRLTLTQYVVAWLLAAGEWAQAELLMDWRFGSGSARSRVEPFLVAAFLEAYYAAEWDQRAWGTVAALGQRMLWKGFLREYVSNSVELRYAVRTRCEADDHVGNTLLEEQRAAHVTRLLKIFDGLINHALRRAIELGQPIALKSFE